MSGFIDLDHLPIGPRVCDLGWLTVNRTQHLIDTGQQERMARSFDWLLTNREAFPC